MATITADDIRYELEAMADERDALNELDALMLEIQTLETSIEEGWSTSNLFDEAIAEDTAENELDALYRRFFELMKLV